MKQSFWVIPMLLLLAATPATQPVAQREVTDLAGTAHLLPEPKAWATVLLFVGIDCPVSNSYVPEINRLAETYGKRGVAVLAVYSGADVTREAVERHGKAYSLTPPAVLDSDCAIADAVGATMTLEAVVLLPDGTLVYRGRVDDQYAALGKKRFAATTHDLTDVLDNVLAGKKLEPRFTRAVGCAIVKPEKSK